MNTKFFKRSNNRKHRLSSGESISEVLVASLLISLAMTALISMVMASFRMIKNSEVAMNQYYTVKSSYESVRATGTPNGNFTITMTTEESDVVPVVVKMSGEGNKVSFIGYDTP